MRDITIARNYAETLFELGEKSGSTEQFGALMDETAAAFAAPSIEPVLMSPRVTTDRKVGMVRDALKGAPSQFISFITAVVRRNRQLIAGLIADEYRAMLDARLGRVRASITLARDADPLTRQVIAERLGKSIGKDVIAAFVTDPAILGGT
ncbi:MAG TPA: F0F1 ATP synthase subunit delta, partial [Gemmatimonadales bacterium]|nr:F0F1 ATP synthase subunit delta [Gemmatimonadales bacterium]